MRKIAFITAGSAIILSAFFIILFATSTIVIYSTVVVLVLLFILALVVVSRSSSVGNVKEKGKKLLQTPYLKSPLTKGSVSRKQNRLDSLTNMTENRLYTLSSFFPLDFFPNKIYIEQKQIIIIYSQFFWSSQDYHILIEDILMPIVEMGAFFATLRLELGPGGFQQNPPPIPFLKKSEALKAKRIIVGLLICHKEKIDLSGISSQEILEKVEEIGRVKLR